MDIYGNSVQAWYTIREFVTEDGIRKQEFRTYLDDDNEEEEDWFDFKIAFLTDGSIKVTDMFVGKASHRKKGIPDALILEIKRLYNKKVISSSNKNKLVRSEWRKPPATKVWERLVLKNKANYNSQTDTFELI